MPASGILRNLRLKAEVQKPTPGRSWQCAMYMPGGHTSTVGILTADKTNKLVMFHQVLLKLTGAQESFKVTIT